MMGQQLCRQELVFLPVQQIVFMSKHICLLDYELAGGGTDTLPSGGGDSVAVMASQRRRGATSIVERIVWLHKDQLPTKSTTECA